MEDSDPAICYVCGHKIDITQYAELNEIGLKHINTKNCVIEMVDKLNPLPIDRKKIDD